MTPSETDDMPMAGGHYSHGLRAGDFVYTAGQVPRDSRRNVIGTTIEEQTAATLENVGRVTGSQLNGVLVEVDVVAYLGPVTTS
jgi:2-iminobutanoate/2-iminopropanoate deaminase